VTPAQWSERPGRPADVVIFDRVQPVELPRARCLFIDTLPPGCPLSFGKMVEAPRVVDWNELHPVTSYASFSDFDSLSMRTLELRGVDETLVLAEAGPLLALIRDDDRESMVLTIDVMKTNWPFRASFPVFFANAVRWLSGDLKQRSVRAGEVAILKVGRGGGTLRITSPSGELYEEAIAPSRSQHAFNRTLELGFYRVELDRPGLEAQSWDFAVNLEAPLESELSPRDTVRLKSTEAPVNARRAAQRRNRALWRWFAWAALLLLLIEWWIFHRRVFV